MDMPGSKIRQIQDALLDAFSKDSLSEMVRIQLDERLETITTKDNLRSTVLELVEWADRTGRLDELIYGASRANPGNRELQQLARDLDAMAATTVDRAPNGFAPRRSGRLIAWFILGAFGAVLIAYLGYLGMRARRESPVPEQVSSTAKPPTHKVCTFPVRTEFKPLWVMYQDALGCPTAVHKSIPKIAEQQFQGGHMFWRSDTDEVYVIYDRQLDGTDRYMGEWEAAWPDWKWDGSYPEGVGLTPPSNLLEPIRGFGWLWRTYYGGAEGKLGWALDKEYGWENRAIAQPFEQGLIFRGSDPKTYLLIGTNQGEFFAHP